MRPIPKYLLIHSAELKSVEYDKWQSETSSKITELKNIRIDASSKLVTDNQNRQISLSAVLFYDCRSSRPRKVEFSHGQKVIFNGREYTIEIIEPLYDKNKLHHYELGLI